MEKLKNIRFNLRFFTGPDTFESVHSVEELEDKLRANLIAFDDLMAYFLSGQLQRWLECHGAKDATLLEKLRQIDRQATNREIVKALFVALDFCFDEQEIDRMLVSYDFPERLRDLTLENRKQSEARVSTIWDEVDAYEAVCRQIIESKQDLQAVKKLTAKVIAKYFPLLELDATRFFCQMKSLKTGCPSVIFELLADVRTRDMFLRFASEFGDRWLSFTRNQSGTAFGVRIDGETVTSRVPPIKWIEDYRDSAYSWKTLLPKGRRVMILCNTGVAVRDGATGKEFEESSLNNKFVILDGCSYRQVFKTKAFLAYAEL